MPVKSVPEARPMDATTAPEMMNHVEDEDEIIPFAPVPRAPSVVISEPDVVRSETRGEGGLPPVLRRSTGSQTLGRERGRGRGSNS